MILWFYINLYTERRGGGNLLLLNLIKSKASLACSHAGMGALLTLSQGSVMLCFLLTNSTAVKGHLKG